MSTQACREPICQNRQGVIEWVIESRSKDLGSIEVRRILPTRNRQRVGPFIFFDHMGPAEFSPGKGIAVRPHPHIGLSALTFLFDGVIQHRDSLGYNQLIRPGAVNWMTAGRGIVHSERTPEEQKATGSRLHGLQVWLALPLEAEEVEPSFVHYPAEEIPVFEEDGKKLALIVGSVFGLKSPVETYSETLYIAGTLEHGVTLSVPTEPEERAVYVVEGELEVGEENLAAGSMAVFCPRADVTLHANSRSVFTLIGGAPLSGERHIWWNFVSSSLDKMHRAKEKWKNDEFPKVPGDPERIPLPES